MISIIGRLVNGAIGWVIPGFPPFVLYGLAILAILSSVAGIAYVKGAEGRSASVAAERSACTLSKQRDAQASAEALAEILASIQSDEPDESYRTSTQLCASSPFCRDKGKNK